MSNTNTAVSNVAKARRRWNATDLGLIAVIAALVVGWLATVVIRRTTKTRALWLFLAATVTSVVVVHSLGVAGIALNTKATLEQAFLSDVVFYPGDIIKNILAAVIAVALHRAFPDILVRRVKRSVTQPAKA